MKKKKNKQNIVEKVLEVPKEAVTGLPKLTLLGFEELLIENYKGVLEYEELYIRISTHIGIININGTNFNIRRMTDEEVFITGKFKSIEIENEELEEN